jgi:cytochrome P450
MALHDTVVDDVRVRRGQTIFIAAQNIQQDPRYWHHADPNQFLPERFLGEDKNPSPYTMLSFGGGHRACIAQDLAWLELKTIIVRLMQRGVTFEDTIDNTGGYKEYTTCLPKNLVVRVHIQQA